MPARKRRLLVAVAMDRASLDDMTTGMMMGWRWRRAVRWILLLYPMAIGVWCGVAMQLIHTLFHSEPWRYYSHAEKQEYVNNAMEHISRTWHLPKENKELSL